MRPRGEFIKWITPLDTGTLARMIRESTEPMLAGPFWVLLIRTEMYKQKLKTMKCIFQCQIMAKVGKKNAKNSLFDTGDSEQPRVE